MSKSSVRTAFILVLLLTALLPASPTASLAAEPAPIIIACARDNEPYSFVSQFGEPSGLFVDVWRLWGEKVGRPVKFRMGSWQETFADLRNGQADIHYGMFHAKSREEWADFGPRIYLMPTVAMLTASIKTADLAQLSNATIAVLRGSHFETYLRVYYPNLHVYAAATHKDMLIAVAGGIAHGAVGPPLPILSGIDRLGLNEKFSRERIGLFEDYICPAVRKGDTEMLALVNRGFAQISRTELIALEQLWVRDPALREFDKMKHPLSLSPAERQWLDAHRLWRVGLNDNSAPLGFIGEEGQYDGVGADMLKVIGGVLGVDIQPVPRTTWKGVAAAFADNRIDIVPFSEKLPPVDGLHPLTSHLLYLPFDVVTLNDMGLRITSADDLAGKTVAVHGNAELVATVGKQLPNATLVPVQTLSEGLAGVQAGQYEALVDMSLTVEYAFANSNLQNLRHDRLPQLRYEARIAVREDSPELNGILQKALESLPYKSLTDIADRWTHLRREQTLDWQRIWQIVGFVLLLAGSVLSVILIWNRKLARESLATQKALESAHTIAAALRQREWQLKAIVDNLPSIVMLKDIEGRFILVNQGFEDFFGLSEPMVIGKTNADLFFPAVAKKVSRTDAEAFAHDGPYLTSIVQYNKQGAPRELDVVKVPMKDEDGKLIGLVITATDTTDRRQAERDARHAQAEMTQIFNAAGSAMRVLDVNKVIIAANEAFLQLYDLRREEIIGTPCQDSAYDWERCTGGAIDRVLGGEARAAETMIYHPAHNGERYYDIVATPFLSLEGELLGVIEDRRDVTELVESQKAMQQAARTAEDANRAKSEFLANMSHEIRTPMNAIIGMAYLALQTKLNKKQHNYLTYIKNSARSLLRIINDILDFSKIEAGRMDMEQMSFNLEEVLQGLAALDVIKQAENKIELLLQTEADVPATLIGDPLRLGQVLINLVGNAVKFTAEGEVIVRVQLLESDDSRVRLQFSITDTGVGMTEQQIANLFRAFSQADMSTTRKFGGTGLGLSISKSLVEMMGGKIWVESTPGEGSTFYFTASFGVQPENQARKLSTEEMFGLRVLVVDDSPASRDILGQMLRGMNFRHSEAASGDEALRKVGDAVAEGDPYKVVLLDWKMPGQDGIEVAEALKKRTDIPLTPAIIMVTAYDRDLLMEKDGVMEIKHFLSKPVHRSQLLHSIQNACNSTQMGEDEPPASAAAPAIALIPELQGKRVLLAEDNEINQIVAQEMLEALGLEVDIAPNGAIAVEKASQGDYAAIFMDIQMPEVDGFEATRRLRADPRFSRLPIIALTAHGMVGDREKSMESGMDDHISKPIDPHELTEAVRRWCLRP